MLTILSVHAQEAWDPLLLKPKYAKDILTENNGSWIIQKIQILSDTSLYKDAVNVKMRQWGGGLLASVDDAKIKNDIGPAQGPVPGVVTRAGYLCIPQFRGALHPVARAVDTQNLKSITLYCALAYSGDKVGLDKAVYIGVIGTIGNGGAVSTQLLAADDYENETYQNLLNNKNDWIEKIKGVYEGFALISTHDDPVDPTGESLPKASDVVAKAFREDELEKRMNPIALDDPDVVARLAVEGKDLFLQLMTEWASLKQDHLTTLQDGEGDPVTISKMQRDLRSLEMDIWGYQNGMRPKNSSADKFPTAWWRKGVNAEQWRKKERYDFWWDLLAPDVFDPYPVFPTTDAAPGLATAENAMKSFVLEVNRKNWVTAGAMILDGGSLNKLVNDGSLMTPIDAGQNILGHFEFFELFSKSAFQLDGTDYVWWILQARVGDQPNENDELGAPIQVITRKEGDGSWSVSTEFIGSQMMKCMSAIGSWPNTWILRANDGIYRVDSISGDWNVDSDVFKNQFEPFFNPSKR
jgi:hypothetical protein